MVRHGNSLSDDKMRLITEPCNWKETLNWLNQRQQPYRQYAFSAKQTSGNNKNNGESSEKKIINQNKN